jgi:hypothetical protein
MVCFFGHGYLFYAILLCRCVGIRSYSYFGGGGGDDNFYLGFFESKTNLKVKNKDSKIHLKNRK